MNSSHLIFDPVPSHHHHNRVGQMLFLGGGAANPIFHGMGMEEGSNKRPRPFFTSPEEMIDEEYYDEQAPEKKRRLTPEQVHMLERSFEEENKLEPERKSDLARKLGLQPRQVAVWFQNRRARWKTKQLERDFDRLKSSYDALLADHDKLRQENDRLRSQVTSLTEKLQAGEHGAAANTSLTNQDNHGEAPVVVAAAATVADNATVHVQQPPEDRLSPGSGGSAVVDGETPQLVDSSGESYFQESYQGGCGIGLHSEEDDGSDEGCSYLPAGVFAAAASDNNDGWWVWNKSNPCTPLSISLY